jgi:hypothetical protein
MGAMKELLAENIESVLAKNVIELYGDEVNIDFEIMDTLAYLLAGDNQSLHDKEHEYFTTLHIDTADFLTDWLHAMTAAIAIFTGEATTEDGLVGNSFDWMAYHFNNSPRRSVRAMQEMGLNDRAVQGIIYLLTGRLLEANEALNIVRFEYMKNANHPTVMSRVVS